jgi:hypothetical protein
VIVKLAPVIGATGSLKLAVTTLVVVGTDVAAFIGDDVVTVGAAAATAPPRIGSLPLLHAAASALSRKLAHNLRRMEYLLGSAIRIALSFDRTATRETHGEISTCTVTCETQSPQGIFDAGC